MERKEYTFKEVDGVSIDADVYFRRDQSAASPIGQFLQILFKIVAVLIR